MSSSISNFKYSNTNTVNQRLELSLLLQKIEDGRERGFCNWLICNKIMIGQYPGQTPELSGPTLDYVQKHIHSLIYEANIGLFCSLQSEVPHQRDYNEWEKKGGKIYLPLEEGGKFPHFFGHYAPIVQSRLEHKYGVNSDEEIQFLHAPILDLSTPSSTSLYQLLFTLLDFMEHQSNNAMCIHCWGGRGRAGLVGACLLSLIYPELDANQCLKWVQKGYDSRVGAKRMPVGLRKSPQTYGQIEFVKGFVHGS